MGGVVVPPHWALLGAQTRDPLTRVAQHVEGHCESLVQRGAHTATPPALTQIWLEVHEGHPPLGVIGLDEQTRAGSRVRPRPHVVETHTPPPSR